MLTNIPAARDTEKLVQRGFGGLDRRPGSRSGGSGGALSLVIRDEKNLSGRKAPLLSTRRPRRIAAHAETPNGLTAYGGALVWVDGTRLVVGGEPVSGVTLTNSKKVFAQLGSRLLIWPDKVTWDGESLTPLEADFTAQGLTFGDGTCAEEQAKANSITTDGDTPFPFRIGDAVTITGCTEQPENNKTPIIREISADGKTLRFYENTFTVPEGQTSVTEPGSVTLARTVPDLDFLCVNENRVWGCRGDTVCCCKPGDPFNWNVFDGLSTDAWAAETGTAGDFTGCFAFMGYPIFFKEDRVFKVYGNRPSNFEMLGAATLGVLPGCENSLAVAGETLLYLSRAGICAYTGGFPSPVGQALDDASGAYRWAAAGSDGVRYYVCLSRAADRSDARLLCYDTQTGLWHAEDAQQALSFAWASGSGLFELLSDGTVQSVGAPPQDAPEAWAEEQPFSCEVTFDRLDMGFFGGKYPVRLWLRYETIGGAALEVYVSYDDGAFEPAAELPDRETVGTNDTPVPIRRCDHFAVRLACSPAEDGDGETESGQVGFTVYDVELDVVPGIGSRK